MLSQASGYAASALGFVACSESKSVLVKEIAEATAIPAPYLAKIVQVLSKRGIVRTQRGIGGGVTLARAPEDVDALTPPLPAACWAQRSAPTTAPAPATVFGKPTGANSKTFCGKPQSPTWPSLKNEPKKLARTGHCGPRHKLHRKRLRFPSRAQILVHAHPHDRFCLDAAHPRRLYN